MIGCEVLGSFSINNFEVKFLEEENVRRLHESKQGLPAGLLPLPEIDWKVESLYDYPFKCFLDAYKGYHRLQMAEEDEEKTAFHTPHGVYCYTKMPFGLKNAGATYQRLVDKLPSPQTVKEVQSLNGKLAGLNRFLSKSAEKSLPVFKTLKKCVKKSDFCWTPEAEQAFKQPKQHISELPMLVAPRPKEELIMYLFASQGAVGAILMMEKDSIHTPVYFVSRPLQGPELNYTLIEKLVLTLVFAAKRLRRRGIGAGKVISVSAGEYSSGFIVDDIFFSLIDCLAENVNLSKAAKRGIWVLAF
ncbi:reverse transcriptase domain-containing protein [Tanacetum coccineum]